MSSLSFSVALLFLSSLLDTCYGQGNPLKRMMTLDCKWLWSDFRLLL